MCQHNSQQNFSRYTAMLVKFATNTDVIDDVVVNAALGTTSYYKIFLSLVALTENVQLW